MAERRATPRARIAISCLEFEWEPECARRTGASAVGESPMGRRRIATTSTPSHGPSLARARVKLQPLLFVAELRQLLKPAADIRPRDCIELVLGRRIVVSVDVPKRPAGRFSGFMNFIDAAPDTGDFPFDFSVSASQPASARIRLI